MENGSFSTASHRALDKLFKPSSIDAHLVDTGSPMYSII